MTLSGFLLPSDILMTLKQTFSFLSSQKIMLWHTCSSCRAPVKGISTAVDIILIILLMVHSLLLCDVINKCPKTLNCHMPFD